jgi:hypothetical protein
MLRRSPVAVKTWMGISAARWSRERDPRRRLLLALGRRGGWRWTQASSASVELQDIESLQKKIGRRVWEMRWEEGKRLREERGYAAHRLSRNWAETVAGAADSDGEILELRGVSGGEGKRGKGGVRGAFYRRPCVEEGLGFPARGARSTARRNHARAGLLPGEGDDPDRWATPVGVWRGGGLYCFGTAGSWAVGSFWDQAEWRPLGLFLFLLFFFFFLNSVLFHNFCIIHSNQFIQIPKFLKSSKQYSKPMRNMFSETKQDF